MSTSAAVGRSGTVGTGQLARPAPVLLLAVVFGALLLSRRPAVLLDAAFWAEDGWVWYPEAYSLGWHSLLKPVAGYLQTLSRLVALAAQAVPLAWAPTVFAAASLVIQALPAAFLVSPRMDRAWPSLWARLLFALIYVALPNSYEVYVNLTNAQWNLAVLAFLVLVSRSPEGWPGRVFDTVVLIVSGLSGPLCLLLVPVAAWKAFEDRNRTSAWRLAAMLAAALVQGGLVLATGGSRSPAPLGAGPRTFARIASMQIFIGALLGRPAMEWFHGTALWTSNIGPALITAAGLAFVGLAVVRRPGLLRQGCLFAALLLGAALLRPQVSNTEAQWPLLTIPGVGNRYYYIPMLAWVGALFALAADRFRPLRWTAVGLLMLLAVGIPVAWRQPGMPATNFAEAARAFALAPPGTRMEFPVHPLGVMPMVLVK